MVLAAHILLLLHLVGFAALFGGVLVQMRSREPEVNAAMVHGSSIVLLSGLVLAAFAITGPVAADGGPVSYARLIVKLVVSLVIAVLAIVNRRFSSIPRGLWALLGILTLGDAAVAVLWQ